MSTAYVPITAPRRWYQRPLFWAALAALVCLGFLALPLARRAYGHWSQKRRLRLAAESMAKGEYQAAILGARRVLVAHPENFEAKRVIAQSLGEMRAPEAVQWWRELARASGGESDHLFGLAESSLYGGDSLGALQTLAQIPEAQRQTERYLELSARVALERKDAASAEQHLVSLLRLRPDRQEARFELARLQLRSEDAALRRSAVATLEEFARQPESQLAALRALLEDAIRTGARAAALELSERLIQTPQAAFADQLRRLFVLRAGRELEFSARLSALQQSATGDVAHLAELIGWMIDNELSLEVAEWVGELPRALTGQPPVAPAMADALVRSGRWEQLRFRVESEEWGAQDFLRHAFRAQAAEKLGDHGNAQIAWNAALALVQSHSSSAEVLARLAMRWHWSARAEEALWKRAAQPRCPRWVAEYLFAAARGRSDTAALRRASELLLKLQPDDLETRNNHAYLLLVAGESTDAPHAIVAALHQEQPRHPRVAATYAFSLLQQERVTEAGEVFRTFSETELGEPPVARLRAAVTAAAGDSAAARPLFVAGAARPLLREERAWIESLDLATQAREADLAGDGAGAARAWQQAIEATGQQTVPLSLLAGLAARWQWPQRAEEILWARTTSRDCPPAVLDRLRASVLQRGDVAGLYKVSRLRRAALPGDLSAQAEFLYYSLLSGEDRHSSQRLAEALARQHSTHAELVVAFALSRIQGGRSPEAVEALEKLDRPALREPRAALCYGLALFDAGREREARDYLEIARGGLRLAEEKALVARAHVEN